MCTPTGWFNECRRARPGGALARRAKLTRPKMSQRGNPIQNGGPRVPGWRQRPPGEKAGHYDTKMTGRRRQAPLPPCYARTSASTRSGLPEPRTIFSARRRSRIPSAAIDRDSSGIAGHSDSHHAILMAGLVGVALIWGSLPAWLLVPCGWLLFSYYFIRIEERMLKQRFGAAYVAYAMNVRRWLQRACVSGARRDRHRCARERSDACGGRLRVAAGAVLRPRAPRRARSRAAPAAHRAS